MSAAANANKFVFFRWGSDKFLTEGYVDAESRFNIIQVLDGHNIKGWRVYATKEGDFLVNKDGNPFLFPTKGQAMDYIRKHY